MADVDGVAIFDDVIFAFDEKPSSLLELHFGGMAGVTGGDEFGVVHDFGADEASGDVAVNRMGGIDGCCALPDGPGADFVFAGREKRNVAKRFLELLGEDVQGRLGNAKRSEKFGAFFRVFDLRDFGFSLSGKFADFGAWAGDFGFGGFE